MSPLELSAHMTIRPGCLEARAKLFRDYADDHYMTVYGEVSPPLLALLHAHAGGHKWFTFLRGLQATPLVPSQVPGKARGAASAV